MNYRSSDMAKKSMINKLMHMVRKCDTKSLHIDRDDHRDMYNFIAINLMDFLLDPNVTWLEYWKVYNKKYKIIINLKLHGCDVELTTTDAVREMLNVERRKHLEMEAKSSEMHSDCVCRLNNL